MSLISLPEYAAKIGRDKSNIAAKARRGDFKTAVKIGRNWLIDENEPYPMRRPGIQPDNKTYDLVYTFSDWVNGSGYSTRNVEYGSDTVTTTKTPEWIAKTLDWSWWEPSCVADDVELTVTVYAADDTAHEHPLAQRSVWASDIPR